MELQVAFSLAAKVWMAVTGTAWLWVIQPLCRGPVLSAAAGVVVGLSFWVMQRQNPAWKGRAGPGITATRTDICQSAPDLLSLSLRSVPRCCRMGTTFPSNDCGSERQGIYIWNPLLEALTGAEYCIITWGISFFKKSILVITLY